VVTSANRSGAQPADTADEAAAALGDGVAQYIEGESGGVPPSTVVDLTKPAPLVLRQGLVTLQ